MKITILTYLDKEGDHAHDMVVDQVAAALKETGHQVSILGIHGDIKKLVSGLTRRKPDLIFNLMEMFGANVFGDIGVVRHVLLVRYPDDAGIGPQRIRNTSVWQRRDGRWLCVHNHEDLLD